MNSYTSENMLMIAKPKGEVYDITNIRTSSKSHIHWKNHFHKNPLYFRMYADLEADNEIDKSNRGKKQLIFINKTRCLMVITYHLIWMIF